MSSCFLSSSCQYFEGAAVGGYTDEKGEFSVLGIKKIYSASAPLEQIFSILITGRC